MALKIGLLGIGKIARDQHIPSLRADPRFELAACASRHATVDGVPSFPDLESMLAAVPDLQAISICTPPQARHDIARQAIDAGLAVLLEKPPCATLSEAEALVARAAAAGTTLFAAWHSRFAATVDAARVWLAAQTIEAVTLSAEDAALLTVPTGSPALLVRRVGYAKGVPVEYAIDQYRADRTTFRVRLGVLEQRLSEQIRHEHISL